MLVRRTTYISWTVILTKLLIFDENINRYLILNKMEETDTMLISTMKEYITLP